MKRLIMDLVFGICISLLLVLVSIICLESFALLYITSPSVAFCVVFIVSIVPLIVYGLNKIKW